MQVVISRSILSAFFSLLVPSAARSRTRASFNYTVSLRGVVASAPFLAVRLSSVPATFLASNFNSDVIRNHHVYDCAAALSPLPSGNERNGERREPRKHSEVALPPR